LSGEKVLVIDDRKENVEFVVDYVLVPHGYQPVTAEDGEEGLHKALTEKPDLILLDMQMPRMSGLEVLEALKAEGVEIPVIIMTFHGSESLAVQVFRLGVKDYVIKPFKVEEMLVSIEKALTEVRLRRERDELAARLMQANRQLEQRLKELNTLYGIGRSVSALLDLEKLLSRAVEAAVYITGAEEGSLLLVDPATDELYMRAARGFDEKYARGFRLKVDDSMAGEVLRTGQPLVIERMADSYKIKTAYLVKSLMYVPLKVEDRVIGILGVDNRVSERTFSNYDLFMLSALADYMAIAIENARLFNEVENQKSKLEAILTGVGEPVIVTDSANRLLLLNTAARWVFTTGPLDMSHKPLAEVIHNEVLIQLFSQPTASQLAQSMEVPLDDGRTFNATLTHVPGVGRVAFMQDITHLKELDRMKSEFVSTVSHDLRSPLTSIRGFVDLLVVAGKLNEQQLEFVDKVKKGVGDITALIDDLLDIGRIEAGVDLMMEACALDGIIREVTDNLRGEVETKEQSLHLELLPELPPVWGNRMRLSQVISNLVGNALKYTPDGGSITVKAMEEGGQVLVSVNDTGVGIPPADLPHIFDKFYRVQSKETEDISGTGLGLSIVKSVIEKHNGRIWVDSELGVGSTFTFILPRHQPSG
jgi:signal transduction histidine kinase/FixJ family two-component response regulator